MDQFYIGQEIHLDFTTLYSSYGDVSTLADPTQLAMSSFGQGMLQISPLHLTMIYQSIAGEGKMLKPYLVESFEKDGKTFGGSDPEVLCEPISREVANQLREALYPAADRYGLSDISVELGKVSAKTGTAECSDSRTHAYLVAVNDRFTYCISMNNACLLYTSRCV